MHKIKSLAPVALALLFGGVFASATAQRRMPPQPIEPPVVGTLSGTYKVAVTANELSTGDIDYTTGDTYGWTCYGTTEGDLSGFMFISMNYSASQPPVGGVIGEIPGGVSNVTGGSWSKLIFVDGQYAGSVYGKIVGGELVWNGRAATISLQLTADEGTGSYLGSTGSGTFEGILDQNSKRSSVSGSLILNY